MATTQNDLGELYKIKGENKKAIRFFKSALEIREQKLGGEHPDVVRIPKNLSSMTLNPELSEDIRESRRNVIRI